MSMTMIKTSFTFLFLLSISSILFGQESKSSPKITEAHVQIQGTQLFMIPPAGFEKSAQFKGFQNPDIPTSMIMVMEIPGPISKIMAGFNVEDLKAQGMELNAKEDLEMQGMKAMRMQVEQAASGMVFSKHLLVFGDEKASIMINGTFLKDSVALGKSIAHTVESAILNTDIDIDPRAELSYQVDEGETGLQLHSVMGNGMMFNRDGKTPTESPDNVTLIIDKSFAQMTILDKKAFCLSRIKKYPDAYEVLEERGPQELTIDGLTGYELFAKNLDKEGDEMYQCILFDGDGTYYLMLGTYKEGEAQAIADIKQMVSTFQRK